MSSVSEDPLKDDLKTFYLYDKYQVLMHAAKLDSKSFKNSLEIKFYNASYTLPLPPLFISSNFHKKNKYDCQTILGGVYNSQ